MLGIYTPTFNLSDSFEIKEKIYCDYFDNQWEGDFGGDLPWSANIGFRIDFTDVVRPVSQRRFWSSA